MRGLVNRIREGYPTLLRKAYKLTLEKQRAMIPIYKLKKRVK